MVKRGTGGRDGGGDGGNTTDGDGLSTDEIEDLVSNIDDSSNSKSKRDGGSSREKYTCKCCGTRVDSGVHKCDRCIEAGCEYGEKKCRFH